MKIAIKFFILLGAISGFSEGAGVSPNDFLKGSTEEPVSNVTVTPQSLDLIEFSGPVNLSCSSSGSSLTFVWMNMTSVVTPSDIFQINDDGSVLTLVNVSRNEHGSYRCNVSNPLGFDISDPANVYISYGPEDTQLKVSPSIKQYGEGLNVYLLCSAESRPSALFQWFLNGEELLDSEPALCLTNIQMSQSGNYSCQAFNGKTQKGQNSQPSVVSVLAAVSNVFVGLDPTDLVEFSSSVSLRCSASGFSPHFFWMNNSAEVTSSNRVQFTDGRSTLTIVNVTRSDLKVLRCHGFNYFSEDFSDPVNISFSYGPENVKLIINPSQEYFKEGSDVSLLCSADSSPTAEFQWFLNSELLPDSGPELKLINVKISANYSCRAFNNRTLKYQSSQPSVISVVESGGFMVGATVGIIIACLIVVVAAAAGGYFICKSNKDVKAKPNSDESKDDNVYETMSQIYEQKL
ncbi:hypothetical protein ILYODFUR_021757 [Ilyodon furcidens]|uniref:Ig-like domain-containing protein n=1 Tax=Ilyodon furcidens TaxID=33524 RepID=A0ABV0UV58_9TELE